MKELHKYFKHKNIQNVLDVGTGTGDFINILTDVFPNAKITGTDPNKDSLKEASDKFPNFDFIEMSAGNLKFPDNTFDAVSISMALHHLPEVQKSLDEMKRVAKSGGWIIVSELFSDHLNEAQQVHKLYHHFRSTTDRMLGISHNPTFKKNEILEMINDAGIQVEFHFDFKQQKNLITKPEDVEERVVKMNDMLERVNNFPEYESLKSRIELFRKKALKFGFQPATRLVLVGKKSC